MKGVRDVSTPHAIMDRGQYLFTFMSGLNQEEMDAEQIESDTNSIFLVETDELFQPLESETIINIGGDSDWGVRPSVALLGSSYGVVFFSNNERAPNLTRLNIRVDDAEAGEVIHSKTADQNTDIDKQ